MNTNLPTIRGMVTHVNAEKHYAFIKPLDDRLPAGVQPSDRGTFFLPPPAMKVVPGDGDIGEFALELGKKGWQVASVISWERQTSSAPSKGTTRPTNKSPRASKPFIHPYNFVSLPSRGLDNAKGVEPFARAASATHAEFNPKLYSGYIDCELETLGPWFIPDPRKLKEDSQHDRHKTLGYFTLDEPNGWDGTDGPATDSGKPAIPAASIRGMVRSVFEAATLSCFSVFDGTHRDFRLGRDLEDLVHVKTPKGRSDPSFVPCRIASVKKDEVTIQLLDGRCKETDDDARPGVLRVGVIHAYKEKVWYKSAPNDRKSKEIPGRVTKIWSDLVTLPDGTQWQGNRVAAVIATVPEALSNRSARRFHVRKVLAAVRADGDRLRDEDVTVLRAALDAPSYVDKVPRVIFGYLHRTGPNIENKHHERIFFRWAEYNQPKTSGSLQERFQRFLVDEAVTDEPSDDPNGIYRTIPRDLFDESVQRLREYSERMPGKDALKLEKAGCEPPRLLPGQNAAKINPPYPSDFVRSDPTNVKWDCGDTCYALLEGDGKDAIVHGLFPVAIPRLRHENSRGELLPLDFYPCSSKHRHCPKCADPNQEKKGGLCLECFERHGNLCPACRVFGWVRDRDGAEFPRTSERVDAVAGHVRFTHGIHTSGDYAARPVTLAILGSPKPTTTMFYLTTEEKSFAGEKRKRWPPALQNLGQPLYRRLEASLRGRKFYRRRLNANMSEDPARSGLKRIGAKRDSQNQTVFLLPKGLKFSFRVYFDNLSRKELGALLFSLSLQVPESWNTLLPFPDVAKLGHAIGHGKPLGMGTCTIRVAALVIDRADRGDRTSRYRSWTSVPNEDAGEPFLDDFGAAWADAVKANPALKTALGDLLELFRFDWPDDPPPIHYPPNPNGTFDENYRWFMQNVKNPNPKKNDPGGAFMELPAPEHERENPTMRLPINPRKSS